MSKRHTTAASAIKPIALTKGQALHACEANGVTLEQLHATGRLPISASCTLIVRTTTSRPTYKLVFLGRPDTGELQTIARSVPTTVQLYLPTAYEPNQIDFRPEFELDDATQTARRIRRSWRTQRPVTPGV